MNDKNIRHSIHIELIKAAALFAREARSSAGDNQRVFAKKVGISNQTLSRDRDSVCSKATFTRNSIKNR